MRTYSPNRPFTQCITRRAIRYNILVNPSGKPHAFRAVDWIVELLNLLIKVIYGGEGSNQTKDYIILESVLVLIFRNSHSNMERNFSLSGLTTTHAEKDMRTTFEAVWSAILQDGKTKSPHVYQAKRPSSGYEIPDGIMRGTEIIEKEGGNKKRKRTGGEAAGEVEQEDEEEDEEPEEPEEPELELDDLNIDGI